MPSHRTGLLIIRAWVEDGSSAPLRADIRSIDDIATGIQRQVTLVQPDAVRVLVDGWIAGVLEKGV